MNKATTQNDPRFEPREAIWILERIALLLVVGAGSFWTTFADNISFQDLPGLTEVLSGFVVAVVGVVLYGLLRMYQGRQRTKKFVRDFKQGW